MYSLILKFLFISITIYVLLLLILTIYQRTVPGPLKEYFSNIGRLILKDCGCHFAVLLIRLDGHVFATPCIFILLNSSFTVIYWWDLNVLVSVCIVACESTFSPLLMGYFWTQKPDYWKWHLLILEKVGIHYIAFCMPSSVRISAYPVDSVFSPVFFKHKVTCHD